VRLAVLLYAVALGVYLADRASKLWAAHVLAGRPVALGPVRLAYTTNSGGAFGIGQRAPLLFAVATVAVAAGIVWVSRHLERPLVALGLGLLLGGALGNLTDRLARGEGFLDGKVVDFVDLRVWPVFNVADSAIVIGALLLLIAALQRPRSAARDEGKPAA
jgi:signal peptidase II